MEIHHSFSLYSSKNPQTHTKEVRKFRTSYSKLFLDSWVYIFLCRIDITIDRQINEGFFFYLSTSFTYEIWNIGTQVD